MDNDNRFLKVLKKTVKRIKFHIDYADMPILDAAGGNAAIAQIIRAGKPAMVARCGATEMRCVEEYLRAGRFSKKIKQEIQDLSGFFPAEEDHLKRFCEHYMEAVGQAELLALWGVGAEAKVVKEKCKTGTAFTRLTALEPYYFDRPWSAALEGKRVLVIHPFEESILKQYKNRAKLFSDPDILPQFASIACVRAVQSAAGQKTQFETWFAALDAMKQEIDRQVYDVAIIGAGAYGLPLAAYVKQQGKIAIQMAGATQILFGIKGKRWEQQPEISRLFNAYWIRPSEAETPPQKEKVEGGSYW